LAQYKYLVIILKRDTNEMTTYKKFEVEIGTNGKIKLNNKVIAILGAWNRLEDLDPDTLYNQIKERNKNK